MNTPFSELLAITFENQSSKLIKQVIEPNKINKITQIRVDW